MMTSKIYITSKGLGIRTSMCQNLDAKMSAPRHCSLRNTTNSCTIYTYYVYGMFRSWFVNDTFPEIY